MADGTDATSGLLSVFEHIDDAMQKCIQNCLNCHSVCEATITHCLGMSGKHAEAAHINIMRDCVQSCITSADFMLRGSFYHTQYCGACADICEACAESCESIGEGDEQMQTCAQMCRRCASTCRRMASHAQTGHAGHMGHAGHNH